MLGRSKAQKGFSRTSDPKSGFTVPELVVVVVIFGAFAALASILIHPVEFGPARRDAERWTGVAHLTQALSRYVRDNGSLPKGFAPGELALIGSDEGMLDLCADLTPRYAKELPIDPAARTDGNATCQDGGLMITGYAVEVVAENTIAVSAPFAEDGDIILTKKF